ncbi:MAG: glycosyltransferase family 2 protein [Clostridiaceae bacterium]|nr:glycosyltransferase family 2 protein [Clostridiaceae bacterium]
MFFSVIMPVFNSEAYLKESISSILDQQFDRFELILVDDGSEDRSLCILREFAERDERIKVVSISHKGVSAARNAGLSLACGDYVTFMDSDDTIDPKTYGCVERALLDFPCDVLFFSIDKIAVGVPGHPNGMPLEDACFTSRSDFMNTLIRRFSMYINSSCNKFFRRDVIENHKIRFKEGIQYGEDRLFNFAVLARSERIRTLPDRFYKYHIRQNGSLSTRFLANYVDILLPLHKAKIEMVEPYGTGTSEFEHFRNSDLKFEVITALIASVRNRNRMISSEWKECLRRFIHAEYPSYFFDRTFRRGSDFWTAYFWVIRLKSPLLLSMLAVLYEKKSRITSKPDRVREKKSNDEVSDHS